MPNTVLRKKIDLAYLQVVLEDCFSTDQELLNTYHIEAGNGLKACVSRTHTDLVVCPTLRFFILKRKGILKGFFGVEQMDGVNFLTGFFIKPQYRDAEHLQDFWKEVNQVFDNEDFFTAIYEKNTRAAKFLEKGKGVITSKLSDNDNNNINVYKFTGCQ